MNDVSQQIMESMDSLEATGLAVIPNFLTPPELEALIADFNTLRAEGRFTRAGIGKSKQVVDTIRRDEVCWLDETQATPAQEIVFQKLELIKQVLNRSLFLGIKDFEGHYAIYEAGAFYQKHLDCFQMQNTRVVSIVIYLNKDWIPSHGGQLRVYLPSETRDIAPIGGTLVCFLSRELEHEVLPSHAERMSFTGWLKQ